MKLEGRKDQRRHHTCSAPNFFEKGLETWNLMSPDDSEATRTWKICPRLSARITLVDQLIIESCVIHPLEASSWMPPVQCERQGQPWTGLCACPPLPTFPQAHFPWSWSGRHASGMEIAVVHAEVEQVFISTCRHAYAQCLLEITHDSVSSLMNLCICVIT